MWFHAEPLGALIDAVAGAGGAVLWTFGVVPKGYLLAILSIFLNTPLNSEVFDEIVP